jgi:hypothetical protein
MKNMAMYHSAPVPVFTSTPILLIVLDYSAPSLVAPAGGPVAWVCGVTDLEVGLRECSSASPQKTTGLGPRAVRDIPDLDYPEAYGRAPSHKSAFLRDTCQGADKMDPLPRHVPLPRIVRLSDRVHEPSAADSRATAPALIREAQGSYTVLA